MLCVLWVRLKFVFVFWTESNSLGFQQTARSFFSNSYLHNSVFELTMNMCAEHWLISVEHEW
jgi:hypothetical protein